MSFLSLLFFFLFFFHNYFLTTAALYRDAHNKIPDSGSSGYAKVVNFRLINGRNHCS